MTIWHVFAMVAWIEQATRHYRSITLRDVDAALVMRKEGELLVHRSYDDDEVEQRLMNNAVLYGIAGMKIGPAAQVIDRLVNAEQITAADLDALRMHLGELLLSKQADQVNSDWPDGKERPKA